MTPPSLQTLLFLPLLLLVLSLPSHHGQLDESARIAAYHARHHHWPPLPSDYLPPTPGWRALHSRRLSQIALLPASDPSSKYNAYMSAVHSAFVAPNFTEYGWALSRAPDGLVDALSARLLSQLELYEDDPSSIPIERFDHDVSGEYPLQYPLLVPNSHLNARALEELLPLHEAWAGVPLIGNNAYGLRVYRNRSNLQMHVDESSTHVVSSILHVGHDDHPDSEPWPLILEDFRGNTHEIYLEKGDMLFYESSKCFHGRPRRFRGEWYSSLFVHYYPKVWEGEEVNLESHFRIPPGWERGPERKKKRKEDKGEEGKNIIQGEMDNGRMEEMIVEPERLVVTETSFKEPDCEHEWCAMKNTIKWKIPEELKFGQFVSGDGVIRSLGLERRSDADADADDDYGAGEL